jgi:sortase (surface protein transpeptidase)
VEVGADIVINLGTGPITYEVKWVKEFGVYANWEDVMSNEVPEDSLTLITCGGAFDEDAETYTHRTVVRAIRS